MELKIISLNINGIRNKVDYIDTYFTDIDILCIQESKLNHKLASSKLFKNFIDYHFIDNKLPGQKGISFLFNNKSLSKYSFQTH